MKDQHEKIKGYRDLTQGEIDLMNEVKDLEAKVAQLVTKIKLTADSDKRFVAIATTDLQKGFMCLVRSIAKPNSSWS